MVLVMSRSIAFGVKAGLLTAIGICTGLLGHTVLAALGVGLLISTSALLFTAFKLLGAGYLIYLGVKVFNSPPLELSETQQHEKSSWTLLLQGAVSNLANPKIAVFFFAFLPQFISHEVDRPTQALLLLGGLFSVLTIVIKGPIAYLAGKLSDWLRRQPRFQIWLNRVSGTVLVGLGLRLITEESPTA